MKGQKYISFQSIFTVIDWWHEPIEGEEFEHQGYLNTFVISPKLLYGLTNKLNLSISGMLGARAMRWDSPHKSIHHRSESTLSDLDNASGGILGDTKVVLNYVLKSTKTGDGLRLYAGTGLTVPSKSELTSDPFFLKNNGQQTKHRHFSLSNGTYNYNLEAQAYYKQSINPIFYGGFITLEKPIAESKYGYLAPTNINLVLSMIYKRFDDNDTSIGYGLNILHTTKGYWNNIEAPNTKSTSIAPSISYLFGSRFGAIAINLQKPIFIDGAFASNEGDMDQGSDIWRFSVSLRGMPSK